MRTSNSATTLAISTRTNKPLIIGHRGASAIAPENTIAAFKKALIVGADGIELDVRLSRDGVPVVIHDATLRRTGLVTGSIGRVDFKQLSRVDVGTWFNRAYPKLARAEFAAARVPTLAQVFELCSNNPAIVYVEMKSENAEAAARLAQTVAQQVKSLKFQDRVIVVSFDLGAIATLKTLNPSIRTGALFGSSRSKQWRAEKILAAVADCGANEILLHRLLSRRTLLEKCHEKNLRVVVWTVDDPKWIARAKTNGIHALITNNPAKLVKF